MTLEQFLDQRFTALQQRDYAAVYASYHPDAPFLQNFPDEDSYLDFARQQLATIQLNAWRILRQRQLAAEQIEVILLLELKVDSVQENFFELALLLKTSTGWRYHSAQKLGVEDYSGTPEDLEFCHFDQVRQKIRY